MKKILLDTHIFLWSILDPSQLSEAMANELEDPLNELWLSPITIWEVMILSEKKLIQLDAPPLEWIKSVLSDLPFREAPLNFEIAMQSRSINLPHKDPADRFIAATASVYHLILATADRNLIEGAITYSVFPNS